MQIREFSLGKNAVALRANAGALFANTSVLPTNACALKELTVGDFECRLFIVGLMTVGPTIGQ